MKRITPLIFLLWFAGCTTTPPAPPLADPQLAWEARQHRMAQVQDWRLEGRLAIQREHEGWHVSINWQQRQQDYSIMLIAPLGQGALRLDGNDTAVTLQTDEGETVSANDPEALLLQQFGWRVPVASLRYWVLGIPAPGKREEQIDGQGRLTHLQQGGWEIRFLDYEPQQGLELPGRVFVNNHQAKVKLVISEWQLQTADD